MQIKIPTPLWKRPRKKNRIWVTDSRTGRRKPFKVSKKQRRIGVRTICIGCQKAEAVPRQKRCISCQ